MSEIWPGVIGESEVVEVSEDAEGVRRCRLVSEATLGAGGESEGVSTDGVGALMGVI